MYTIRIAIVLFFIICKISASDTNELSHEITPIGIATLQSDSLNTELAYRFKAKGIPVFLISDVRKGLSIGDIIRFENKAILVDADVWTTLESEGLFTMMTSIEVFSYTGSSNSSEWKRFSGITKNENNKNGFLFFSELLKTIETHFGMPEYQSELYIQFKDSTISVLAPRDLFQHLKFKRSIPIQKKGKPQFITQIPQAFFVGKEVNYSFWAVDPSEPSTSLQYYCEGIFPEGISWDSQKHAITGVTSIEGNYPVRISVANSKGVKDTLEFTFITRRNEAPVIANIPPETIPIDSLWHFTFLISDKEYSGENLDMNVEASIQGARFNSANNTLTFYPYREYVNSDLILNCKVWDPTGDTNYYSFKTKIIDPKEEILLEAIQFAPPWDTMISGHTYQWDLAPFNRNLRNRGFTLSTVQGDDALVYENQIVYITPNNPGNFNLNFKYEIGKDSILWPVSIPVIEDKAPIFKSEVGMWQFTREQEVNYLPVAIDEDSVTITVTDSNHVHFENGYVKFKTDKPGFYTSQLQAEDLYGNKSYQRLHWEVLNDEKTWYGGAFDFKILDDYKLVKLYYRNAMGRIGILTPKPERIAEKDSEARHYPFLFAGLNLVSDERSRNGEYCYVDVGVTLRRPHDNLFTGGIYIGVEARSVHKKFLNMQSFFDLSISGNQLIVVADTSGLLPDLPDATDLPSMSEIPSLVDSLMTLGEVETMQSELVPIANILLHDYADPDNINIILKYESLFPLAAGFSVGPVYQMHARPTSMYIDQRIGLSLSFQYWFKNVLIDQKVRFAPDIPYNNFRFWWDSRIEFGKWK